MLHCRLWLRHPPAYTTKTHEQPVLLSIGSMQVIALAAWYLVAMFTSRSTGSLRVYRICLQAIVATHMTRLMETQALPPLRPFQWSVWQGWLIRVSQTSDAHYLFVAFLFMGQSPALAVMFSPVAFAALRLAAYVRRVLVPRVPVPALERACGLILSKQVMLLPALC
jgi:Transmembrane protein 33/Nucleoporin POM33